MAKEIDKSLLEKLRQSMDSEAMSCSMDCGCMTPLYVYMVWGESVPLNEIVRAVIVINRG